MVSPDGQVSAAEEIIDGFDEPEVAVGARGDVIVAWSDREKRLWTRYRPDGGPLGPPELAAPNASALLEALPLALDAAGGAVIAWTPEDGAGGLHVRFRDPARGRGREQTLGGRDVYRPKLALRDNGGAVMAWNRRGPVGRNSEQVVVATRAPGGTFGRPVELSRSDAEATDERGFAPARVVDREREATNEPAFAITPSGLAAVPDPPHWPRDPIRWLRVPLS